MVKLNKMSQVQSFPECHNSERVQIKVECNYLESLHHSVDIKEENTSQFYNEDETEVIVHDSFSVKIEQVKSSPKNLACGICNKDFQEHSRTHASEKPFECNMCGYKCSIKHHLVTHLRIHTGEKPFHCNYCDYKCSRRDNLHRHQRTHSDMKPEKSENGKTKNEKWRQQLASHLRTHTGEKSFCNLSCPLKTPLTTEQANTVPQVYKLKTHPHIRSEVRNKKVVCEICGKELSCVYGLKDHLKIHTGDKSFKCEFCPGKFLLKQQLRQHLMIHTGKKSFKCMFCEYTCLRQGSLTSHLKIHTGEKTYACKFCSYTCLRKIQLQCHLRTHTGERPYGCDMCEKKFKMRNHLDEHIKSHTGERPFKCEFCDFRGANKSRLNRHLKTHIRK